MKLDQIMNFLQIIPLVAYIFFSRTRLLSYLHVFQQEEYQPIRFLRWQLRTHSFDRRMSAAILIATLPWALGSVESIKIAAILLLAIAFVVVAVLERRHQRKAKKPLVMTSRARRIFEGSWILSLLVGTSLALSFSYPVVWLFPVHALTLCIILANFLLMPIEQAIKHRYTIEARSKVNKLSPVVIGITGSYGKTSTKHILGHLLQYYGPTLITPGSVNTPMGVSRIIREDLRASHRFFVVEMGAYGRGSIAKLCNLVSPTLGVITTIGSAHLERFGSIETTAEAKSELAVAVLEAGGTVIVNQDVLSFSSLSRLQKAMPDKFVTCGKPRADVELLNPIETKKGLEFSIGYAGTVHSVFIPLYGLHHALNAALAFGVAATLGMKPNDIAQALATVPQVSHRLELKRLPNGAIIIDDTYNSNPSGFEAALKLLKVLRGPGSRVYVLTPGMAELGSEHDAQHRKLGKLAAQYADALYVVGQSRIRAFVDGWREAAADQQAVHTFASFKDAYAAVEGNLSQDDILLMENDLPDLYEKRLYL